MQIEVRTALDPATLQAVQGLVARAEDAAGYAPLGEQKHAQLRVGVRDWTGLLAWDAAAFVGYAHLRWNPPGAVPRVTAEIVVHPDRAEADLVPPLLEAAADQLGAAGGGVLYLWVHHVVDPAATVAARLGLAVQRALSFMARDLDGPPPVHPPPPGVELRAFRRGVDDKALLEANNRAFAGHPENGGWTADDLAARLALPWVDPDGILLAWRGEELLGFHWTKVDPPGGEVYVLGLDPAAQGLGLGRVLLSAGLQYLAARRCARVVLYVDQANPAAMRLYTGEGFATLWLEVCYTT